MQDTHWRPLVSWVEEEFGVRIKTVEGLMSVKQSPETVERLRREMEGFDPLMLAGMLQPR